MLIKVGLLLKPEPRPQTLTLINLDPEKPKLRKTCETAGYRKKIVRSHNIIY